MISGNQPINTISHQSTENGAWNRCPRNASKLTSSVGKDEVNHKSDQSSNCKPNHQKSDKAKDEANNFHITPNARSATGASRRSRSICL